MILTKYEHACFTVELDGKILVVDPGGYTHDFTAPDNVYAVVITHEHRDHLDIDQLRAIATKNLDALVLGHPDVVGKLTGFNTKSVVANERIEVGPFELEFHGGAHAIIDPTIPIIVNLGVMINGLVYYPGDSFVLPNRPVSVLALPVAAPWLKISDTVAFARKVKPKRILPTHDAILSGTGKELVDRIIPELTKDTGSTYQRPAKPIDI